MRVNNVTRDLMTKLESWMGRTFGLPKRLLSRSEIDQAFRLCLKRNVLDERDYHFFGNLPSLDEVYSTIFESPEFRGRLLPFTEPLGREPLDVDVSASVDQLAKLMSHVEKTWTRLGNTEPHWSVITDARFKSDQFVENEAFYAETGKYDELQFAAAAERVNVDLTRFETCFELGCGTGRVTKWLSQRFRRVIAADISSAHLKVARLSLAEQENVTFIHLTSIDSLAGLSYDAVYSRIVLQHNPPPVIAEILKRLLNTLRPNGVAYFQVPVWISGYRFNTMEYMRRDPSDAMEMHMLPQAELLSILQDAGCRVCEIREDPLGAQFGGISNTLFVEKLM